MHREMRTAISIARQLFADEDEDDRAENVLVSGENNLLSIPDFGELEKLKQLFDTFKTKQVLFACCRRACSPMVSISSSARNPATECCGIAA